MRALVYLVLMYLAAYLSACGRSPAPAMQVDVECQLRDTVLQIEVDYINEPDHDAYCRAAVALWAGPVYDAYQEWRRADMAGVVVRMRAVRDLRETAGFPDKVGFAVGGHTYTDAIDLARGDWIALAHEMNHVVRGPGHGGWCVDFGPWAWETLHDDERAYLQCDNY